jgi:hypothetical protein
MKVLKSILAGGILSTAMASSTLAQSEPVEKAPVVANAVDYSALLKTIGDSDGKTLSAEYRDCIITLYPATGIMSIERNTLAQDGVMNIYYDEDDDNFSVHIGKVYVDLQNNTFFMLDRKAADKDQLKAIDFPVADVPEGLPKDSVERCYKAAKAMVLFLETKGDGIKLDGAFLKHIVRHNAEAPARNILVPDAPSND